MRRRSPRQVSEREMTHLARRSAAINELLRLDGGDQSQRESETQGHGGCCCVVVLLVGGGLDGCDVGVCWVDDRSTEVALARRRSCMLRILTHKDKDKHRRVESADCPSQPFCC